MSIKLNRLSHILEDVNFSMTIKTHMLSVSVYLQDVQNVKYRLIFLTYTELSSSVKHNTTYEESSYYTTMFITDSLIDILI